MIDWKVWVKSNFGRKASVRGWEWETWEPSVIQTSQGELLVILHFPLEVLKKTDSNLLVSMWPEKALVSLFLPDKTEHFSYMSHVNMNFQIWIWLWHMYTFKCDTHTSSYRVSYVYIFVQCVILPGMAFVYLASSNPALLVSSPLPPFPYTPSSSGHRSRWTPSSPSSSSTPSTPSTTSSFGHRSRWRSFTSW